MLDDYKSDSAAEDEIIVCGCGTTIWGIKPNGEDVFWTALGDDINVLELASHSLIYKKQYIKHFSISFSRFHNFLY